MHAHESSEISGISTPVISLKNPMSFKVTAIDYEGCYFLFLILLSFTMRPRIWAPDIKCPPKHCTALNS